MPYRVARHAGVGPYSFYLAAAAEGVGMYLSMGLLWPRLTRICIDFELSKIWATTNLSKGHISKLCPIIGQAYLIRARKGVTVQL